MKNKQLKIINLLLIIFAWIVRAITAVAAIKYAAQAGGLESEYDTQVFFAKSAMQASQLSGEMILVGISILVEIFCVFILWLLVEFSVKEIRRFIGNRIKAKEDGEDVLNDEEKEE